MSADRDTGPGAVDFQLTPGEGIGPVSLGKSWEELSAFVLHGEPAVAQGISLQWPRWNITAVFPKGAQKPDEVSFDTGIEFGRPPASSMRLLYEGREVGKMSLSDAKALFTGRELDSMGSGSRGLGVRFGGYEHDDVWVGYWRVTRPASLNISLLPTRRVGCFEFGLSRNAVAAFPVVQREGRWVNESHLELPRHGLSCHFDERELLFAVEFRTDNLAATRYHLVLPVELRFEALDFEESTARMARVREKKEVIVEDNTISMPQEGTTLSYLDGHWSGRLEITEPAKRARG